MKGAGGSPQRDEKVMTSALKVNKYMEKKDISALVK